MRSAERFQARCWSQVHTSALHIVRGGIGHGITITCWSQVHTSGHRCISLYCWSQVHTSGHRCIPLYCLDWSQVHTSVLPLVTGAYLCIASGHRCMPLYCWSQVHTGRAGHRCIPLYCLPPGPSSSEEPSTVSDNWITTRVACQQSGAALGLHCCMVALGLDEST